MDRFKGMATSTLEKMSAPQLPEPAPYCKNVLPGDVEQLIWEMVKRDVRKRMAERERMAERARMAEIWKRVENSWVTGDERMIMIEGSIRRCRLHSTARPPPL